MSPETVRVPSKFATEPRWARSREAPASAPVSGQRHASPPDAEPEGVHALGLAGDAELPDVTGILVLCVVALGLFILPLAVTLAQGPVIFSGLLH